MRLTAKEIQTISEIFEKVFKRGELYLFGSRVDDSLKGGDIDLFVVSNIQENMLEKKLDFLALLKQSIGDQKIDVVIAKDSDRLIEKEALAKGVRLCKI